MKKLPQGWKLKDVYGDGDLIAVSPDESRTAWIDDGKVFIGDKKGYEYGDVPLEVIDALKGK